MIDLDAVNSLKATLAFWLQYPLPIITEQSTESERLWRAFLIDKQLAFNALTAK
jgi:hypothetical protein